MLRLINIPNLDYLCQICPLRDREVFECGERDDRKELI